MFFLPPLTTIKKNKTEKIVNDRSGRLVTGSGKLAIGSGKLAIGSGRIVTFSG